VDRLAATLAKRLPRLLDKADAVLPKTDRLIDTVKPEDIERIVADTRAITKNLRSMSEDLKPLVRRLDPIAKNVGIIMGRAAKITEKAIRRFFQIEGMRVRVALPKGAHKARLQQMGIME
jgi:uncharacterized protein YoxC